MPAAGLRATASDGQVVQVTAVDTAGGMGRGGPKPRATGSGQVDVQPRAARPAPRLGGAGEMVGRWVESLPFEPTGDQRAAFAEIDADLDSGQPLRRLLMGEVGSGQTVVALYAMLRALEAGLHGVLTSPTHRPGRHAAAPHWELPA